MSTFLDMVNKAIEEGGSELDLLSSGTWVSATAGRRLYPRIKRNIADAWKKIQMQRFEWVFKNKEVNALLLPRIKFQAGFRTTAPLVGHVYEGVDSGFRFTVSAVKYLEGDWTTGDAVGQLEFIDYTTDTMLPILGETFEEVTPVLGGGSFEYIGAGTYKMEDFGPLAREPLWETFVVRPSDGGTPLPAVFVPFENWANVTLSWAGTSYLAPAFVSKDYEGALNFFPASFIPFHVSFIMTTAPQILTNWDDEPAIIPPEYHDWIAWEALMNIARFDKNPDLMSYAGTWAAFYRGRAERELMPPVAWGANKYAVMDILT